MATILVVDDDATNRKLLRVTLEAEGFGVLEAGDGAEALAALRTTKADGAISDVLMPRMDGFQLCRAVRESAELCRIAFIILTSTYTNPDDERLARDLGADDFLRRPAPAASILKALRAALGRAPASNGKPAPADAPGVMKDYSEALVRKLEEKHADLRSMKAELERRVKERTSQLAKANRQLERQASRLRALTSELTLAEERERRRVAEVLHDQLQQFLAAAKLRLDGLGRAPGKALRRTAKDVGRLLDRSIECSRSLTADLSPSLLSQKSFDSALHLLAMRMERQWGLRVGMRLGKGALPKSENAAILLYRSVRELIANVAKHARVKTVRIAAERVRGQLRISVSDDGAGFAPARAAQAGGVSAFGLVSVQERLRTLGGRMVIDSAPGRGSRVTLWSPAADAAPPGEAPAAGPSEASGARRLAPKPAGRIRVLLADDHPAALESIARLLAGERDLEVVGRARDGREAVELAEKLEPDVVLMDVRMPNVDGIEATRVLAERRPQVKVVGLSTDEEPETARRMLAAGARAFLSKNGPSRAIARAIRACHGGQR